ncbi:tRNA lysidine(34) synthetase TilS [Lentilitoribacter sp. EG35]|uniref:tRNA lysidine(34) synthetase TilS n=1 Tax=Lentilitoribacter sp. EG35 TaxID=3234192 RepID=UPI00345F2E61
MNDHVPNASLLIRQAEYFLKSLKPGPLAIAVSGGSDSLGALFAISEANDSDREIICFTVDHQLRTEAADEALYVGEICRSLGIKHQILKWVGEKPVSGIQKAARHARYKLLADACAAKNAVGVVTGHIQDDQLETVAMRSARNNSDAARGLSGMAPATLFYNQMWVFRPFLSTTKAEFQTFLDAKNQAWIEDPSNQDDQFERVLVRKQADFVIGLPEIMRAQKLRTKIAIAAAEYLSTYCIVKDGLIAEVEIKLDDIPVLLRAVESLICVIGGRNRTLSSQQLERIERFTRSDNPKPMTLGRAYIAKKAGMLFLQRENRNLDVIEIGAQSDGMWDGRYWIKNNHQKTPLVVSGDSQMEGFPPKLFWKIDDVDSKIDTNESDPFISVRRYANRFDEVLTFFDMPLATEIAKLFASRGIKASPFVGDP